MNKNEIEIRIDNLRREMKKNDLSAYIILTEDFHSSEYVGAYFKCREYISGFTGSAGTVVITMNEAGLWTDGRYFLQAEEQLKNTSIKLNKMGEEHVPTVEDYLQSVMKENERLGIDGRTLSVMKYRKISEKLSKKGIIIETDLDLITKTWENRPKMSCESIWELDIQYTGQTRKNKIEKIREEMDKKNVDATIISSLDDVAWLLNLRGNNIEYTPVFLSYLILTNNKAYLYVQEEAISKQTRRSLEMDGIELHPYMEIYRNMEGIDEEKRVYIDPNKMNFSLYGHLKKKKIEICEGKNLTLLPKAKKNHAEVNNFKIAHIKDAVACTKFIYWLKKHIGKEKITEISAAMQLEKFRKEQKGYIEPSFATIAGYAEHGAIVHYSATEESNIELQARNFFLVDSGGHYMEGTTDITRTIALGELTEEQKHHYTLVLRGNLRIANAKFKYGCSGINLDYLAREALWSEGLDYNHGTGHGVGYMLNVHEGPNSFRYKTTESREECVALEEGMITSDEPGLYLEGKYGIRIENLMVCKKLEKNEYGQFMGFETLTLVPMEREAILAEEMTEDEVHTINQYHQQVYDTLKENLTKDEREWLYQETRPISR